MAVNRIFNAKAKGKPAGPPKKNTPPVPPGFVLCPPTIAMAHAWQQEIYRLAYERAIAETQVPRFHRMLFSVWN